MIHLKHLTFTILLVCVATLFSFGQNQSDSDRFDRIENQKIAYITKQLNISASEARRFLPIYNQYNKDIRAVKAAKSDMKAGQRTGGNGRDVIEFDAREVEVKKLYRSKFADVIGQARASQFFVAEEEFKDMLYKEWQNRRKK